MQSHTFPFSYDEIHRWHQYYVALYQQLIYYALTLGSLSELTQMLTSPTLSCNFWCPALTKHSRPDLKSVPLTIAHHGPPQSK
jgi:hypothetical protein